MIQNILMYGGPLILRTLSSALGPFFLACAMIKKRGLRSLKALLPLFSIAYFSSAQPAPADGPKAGDYESYGAVRKERSHTPHEHHHSFSCPDGLNTFQLAHFDRPPDHLP